LFLIRVIFLPPNCVCLGTRDHYYSSAATTLLDPGGEMEYSVADLDDDDYPDLVFMQERKGTVWWGSPWGYSKENRTELPVEAPISNCAADFNR